MCTLSKWLNSNDVRIIFLIALTSRLIVYLLIPIDWNSDSYHHWLISYLTLHIGFGRGRIWDLLGCDYYWGMIPHLIQACILYLFRTSSIEIIRLFNILIGSINTSLIYKIADTYYGNENAILSGISYAIFPISSIFDSIGMQDTIALNFVLFSLHYMRKHYFWSGIFLGFACHSRVEYTLISFIVLTGFIMRERLNTSSQPYLLGWLVGWGIPTLHIYLQTGNPIYPLYYSLYSVFGGYTSKFKGLPFCEVMYEWISSRSQIWGNSFYGLTIIIVILICLFLIQSIVWKRWSGYEPILYWASTLMVLSPLFLPYFESDISFLLMMIRFILPIVALGLPLFFKVISQIELYQISVLRKFVKTGFIVAMFLSNFLTIPHYMILQNSIIEEFEVVDKMGAYYNGGTIICDIPSMVYRLVIEYNVNPRSVLSNLYCPKYFGLEDPLEYLNWIKTKDIRVWMYYDERGDPVWYTLEKNYPGILVNLFGEPRDGCYYINYTLVDSIL